MTITTPQRPLRILHADDDESFRLLVDHAVRDDPVLATQCEFRFVPDGADAVGYILGRGEHADRHRFPLPHLIILDQRMTSMDGYEALRIIKDYPAGKRIPVFIFSTGAQASLVDACLQYGASFCITKPLDFARLRPKLRLIVDFAVHVLELTQSEV